jgi:hypothetical protein
MTAHNQWLPKTRSIPYWTASVFHSIVTNLVLIYESPTYSASVVRWLALHSWTMNFWILLRWNHWTQSQSQCYITTDGQPVSLSWYKAPIWGLRPDIYYCLTVASLLMWGTLSDERTGLPFTIAAGPRQRSRSWVRVPLDSRPYFTLSDSRLPFSLPPTTRRATMEVFELTWTELLYNLGVNRI